MKTLRTLSIAALAVALAGPAFAAASEVTLYDAPQQKDAFFQTQRGAPVDVDVTGSLATPTVGGAESSEMPFWAAHERVRVMAEDNG
ncbi:hypothetical protein [Salinarimonas ramus]|uniref:Uncharacterized protein n=1 Tax=Salinarimonas ramus TaxID=690164 RepID=A0A917Q5J8_9HYPH|nr:hypothetical protein [Salinarimonas ramus]GGK25714.1 hypothetical protein GCM10011322_10310 [Salinarimonas ramus]